MKKPYVKPQVQTEKVLSPVVCVRFDQETQGILNVYMTANSMNASQAIRTLILLALHTEESADVVFRRQAFREGVILGLSAMKARMADAVDAALEDFE